MDLKGKKILLGITGSIAAYKSVILLRLLIREGAEVKVILTPFAEKFVTKGTLAALSTFPVLSEFFKEDGTWNSHVDYGNWADLFLIAPLTATTLAKMAIGMPDNLLVASYLAAKCPVAFAPAMDLDMYLHPSTQKNIATLQSYGNILIEPSSGELASGLQGIGRLQEPEIILERINPILFPEKKKLKSQRILITAGPTFEPIDPVRFLGNHSTGKMGFAIAEVCANEGADVVLVSGPVSLEIKNKSITLIRVQTASEMYSECMKHFSGCKAAILSAAVADFSPAETLSKKVKREKADWSIVVKPTKDIAAELGSLKQNNQVLVGFALETNNELENAKDKLVRKNLDFIVLNSLNDAGAGFGTDTNKISIIDKNNKIDNFELKSKQEVAVDIVNKLIALIK